MSKYWMVHMGRLDHINQGCSYAFPTADAAKFFALNHKRRAPHRDISVETPAGTMLETPLTPGEFFERNFEAEMKLSDSRKAEVDRAVKQRIREEANAWLTPA